MAVFTESIALLIDAKTGAAVTPLGQLESQAKKTDTAFDKMGKTVGVTGATMKTALVAGATALIGTGLVAYLQSSAEAYVEAATAANQLSQATNASVEEASRFNAVASAYGLGLNDLTEIFSDFQQSATASKDELAKLGVQLTVNKDGTTNWIATATDFLEVMQDIPDATERNRLLFKYFGEEGAKQLMSLVNSGRSVKDAMEAIDTARIFGTADVAAAQDYNRAMQDLAGSAKGLQFALGRTLVPMISAVAAALVPLVEIIGAVPPEMYLVVGAAFALNAALTSSLAVGIARTIAGLLTMAATMGVTQAATFTLAAAWESMTAVLVANPIGLVVAALAVAVGLAVKAQGDFNDKVDESAAALAELEKQGIATADGIRRLALESENTDSVLGGMAATVEGQNAFEKLATAVTGAAGWLNVFRDSVTQGGDSLKAYEEAIAKVREEQGEYGVLTADAAAQQDDLNTILAEGGHSAEELADAVNAAGAAQRDKNRVDEEAKGLMEAYAAASWDAVDATLAMIDKNYAARDAQRDFKDQIDETNKILKDADTSKRERAAAMDDLSRAALDAAQATVTLAEQQALLRGESMSAAESTDLLVESLRNMLDTPGLSKAAKESIQDLIGQIETAQTTAGEGVLVAVDVTDADAVAAKIDEIKNRIRDAAQAGNQAAVASLQAELDKLKGVQTADVKVNVTGVDVAKATLTNLTGDREVKMHVDVQLHLTVP